MAAFTGTPTSSTEYALVGTRDNEAMAIAPRLHIASFSYTHTSAAGTGTGEINLCKLPPGRIRIYSDLCRLVSTAFEANADLHLGTRAYVEQDGDTVAEDDNRFADNLDAGGGALDQVIPLPSSGAPWHDLDSQDGIIVYAMVDTGDIAAGDTIHGYITYGMIP